MISWKNVEFSKIISRGLDQDSWGASGDLSSLVKKPRLAKKGSEPKPNPYLGC